MQVTISDDTIDNSLQYTKHKHITSKIITYAYEWGHAASQRLLTPLPNSFGSSPSVCAVYTSAIGIIPAAAASNDTTFKFRRFCPIVNCRIVFALLLCVNQSGVEPVRQRQTSTGKCRCRCHTFDRRS